MSRSNFASWATCALVVSLCVPAAFADRSKSLADCATFDQTTKNEDIETFTVKNACQIPIDCTLAWKVVCAPESKKRRAAHPGSSKFTLADGASQTAEASVAVCGNDAWAIEGVEWACLPNKD
jgi:hypothetical protein